VPGRILKRERQEEEGWVKKYKKEGEIGEKKEEGWARKNNRRRNSGKGGRGVDKTEKEKKEKSGTRRMRRRRNWGEEGRGGKRIGKMTTRRRLWEMDEWKEE
jgi:hypothetical protein